MMHIKRMKELKPKHLASYEGRKDERTKGRSHWTIPPSDIHEVSWVSRTFSAKVPFVKTPDSPSHHADQWLHLDVWCCKWDAERVKDVLFLFGTTQAIGEMILSIMVFCRVRIELCLNPLQQQPLSVLPVFPQETITDKTSPAVRQAERTDSFTRTQCTESEPVNCVINTFVLKRLCNEWHLWQEQHEMMMAVT